MSLVRLCLALGALPFFFVNAHRPHQGPLLAPEKKLPQSGHSIRGAVYGCIFPFIDCAEVGCCLLLLMLPSRLLLLLLPPAAAAASAAACCTLFFGCSAS